MIIRYDLTHENNARIPRTIVVSPTTITYEIAAARLDAHPYPPVVHPDQPVPINVADIGDALARNSVFARDGMTEGTRNIYYSTFT